MLLKWGHTNLIKSCKVYSKINGLKTLYFPPECISILPSNFVSNTIKPRVRKATSWHEGVWPGPRVCDRGRLGWSLLRSVKRFIYYSSLKPAIRWIFLRQGRAKYTKDPLLTLQKNPEHGLLALRLTPRPMSNHQCSNFTPVLSHSCCLPAVVLTPLYFLPC